MLYISCNGGGTFDKSGFWREDEGRNGDGGFLGGMVRTMQDGSTGDRRTVKRI